MLKQLLWIPFISLVFLMFLPAAGFVLFGYAVWLKCIKTARSVVDMFIIPAPTVGAAFLTGTEPTKPAQTDLEEIEDEIARRKQGHKQS